MKRLAPLFLTVFVDVLALTLVLPLLPYYAQSLGATPRLVGLLLASFSLCQFASGPLLGRLSDRFGRKPVLVASQLGTFVGLLMIGLTNRIEWLFAGRIVDGITAGNLSIAQAIIADQTRVEERTKAFGFFGIAFGVGFLVGPAASGLLAKKLGYHAPPLGAAALSLLSVVLTASLVPSTPPGAAPRGSLVSAFRGMLARRAPRTRMLELFFYVASFSMLTGGLAMFLERRMSWEVDQVGYAFAYSGLIGGLMQGGIGRLAARLGEERLAAFGVLSMAVGYIVLGSADSLLGLGVALGLGGIGSAVVRPALTTLLTASVGEDERGLVLGVSQSGSSLAQALGPALAGVLIQRGALAAWAYVAAALSLTSLGSRWLFLRRSV